MPCHRACQPGRLAVRRTYALDTMTRLLAVIIYTMFVAPLDGQAGLIDGTVCRFPSKQQRDQFANSSDAAVVCTSSVRRCM